MADDSAPIRGRRPMMPPDPPNSPLPYAQQTTPIPRRQELPPAFHRDGSVYVTRREVVLHGNSLYGDRIVGYVVEDLPWVNIDTASDWARAEELLLTRACPPPVPGTTAGCAESVSRGQSLRCDAEASK